jgi:hypothetical protein
MDDQVVVGRVTPVPAVCTKAAAWAHNARRRSAPGDRE